MERDTDLSRLARLDKMAFTKDELHFINHCIKWGDSIPDSMAKLTLPASVMQRILLDLKTSSLKEEAEDAF